MGDPMNMAASSDALNSDFHVCVFAPKSLSDPFPQMIGTFTSEEAAGIVSAHVDGLQAEEIAEIRWADVLAARIVVQATTSGFDAEVAASVLALAFIDRRPLGRLKAPEVRFIEARIDDAGALSIAATDRPDDRAEMRRRMFVGDRPPLAA